MHIKGRGPFRFLVDTGAEASVVSPGVARRLGLTPSYRVEVVTVNGRLVAPGAEVTSVSVGNSVAAAAEVVWYELAVPGVDGILGQSFLKHFAYRIDLRRGTAVIGEVERPSGVRVPLEMRSGRPAVMLGGRWWALDSGATQVVLFRRVPGWRKGGRPVEVLTAAGRTLAEGGTLCLVRTGGAMLRDVPAVLIEDRTRDVDGLLPLGLFASVYVNAAERVAVIELEE